MKSYRFFILLFVFAAIQTSASAQTDKKAIPGTNLLPAKTDSVNYKDSTASVKPLTKKDTVAKHIPRIATRRSAILPGWGQAYNREYWKIPIVYGILAIPVGFYFYNNSYYKKTKFAYEARFLEAAGDSSQVKFIDPQLTSLSISSLQSYRNSFRRDRDYSLLWFLIAWGLQVADATVFAHLKQFDVSNDLSMQVKPLFNPQTKGPGLSLTLNLKNPGQRTAISR
jgi:hypothetical protein